MIFSKLTSGRVLGGMLLTSGSCIGAGMLGLPILTGLTGFFPSLIIMLIVWAFMTYTALLLVETTGWFTKRVNLISMVGQVLGKKGQAISWTLYLFLFYALLVAYVAVSGKILHSMIPLSTWVLGIIFTVILGYFIYYGTRWVDLSNRWMMVGLIVCYIAMILLGLNETTSSLLAHVNFRYILIPMSVLVTSFGFHNIIPSLTAYMNGDLARVRTSILSGSILTLVIYLLWNLFVLGVVPFQGKDGLYESFISGQEATIALTAYIKSPFVWFFIQGFSLFAIITSFLAQGMGLMHFIADGIHVEPEGKNKKGLISLVLLPPLILAQVYPKIFFDALFFAGGFCAVVLFGILPALMVWIGRYQKKLDSPYHVCGGKVALFLVGSVSSFLFVMEILRMTGIIERT